MTDVDHPEFHRLKLKLPPDLERIWLDDIVDTLPIAALDSVDYAVSAACLFAQGCTEEIALWFVNTFVEGCLEFQTKFVIPKRSRRES